MTRTTFAAIAVMILLAGCMLQRVEKETTDAASFKSYNPNRIAYISRQSPFLKAHMKNGNLYVFKTWKADANNAGIVGTAQLFDPQRIELASGDISLPYDSIAVIETNVLHPSGAGTALTVFTAITVAVAIYCQSNPKACFGSCPTFYASDGDSMRLEGEGFSSSVAPSLEATDVDALFHARPKNGELDILMKNEALETHVVRWVDVLAVPQREGCRVFATNEGAFWESTAQVTPRSAAGPEGDCLAQVRDFDGHERISHTDGNDLAAKESVDLSFDVRPGHCYGLVIACRQSLLPTYLLYQTYAYMGSQAGHWIAEIERGKFPQGAVDMERLIGGIDVSTQQQDGSWRPEGAIAEHGPLATDVHLLRLDTRGDPTVNVRLTMTKGTWRIDYVALAELTRPLTPVRLSPASVWKEGNEDPEAREMLRDSSKVLVTFPGDQYLLNYMLPDRNVRYELFVESRGYYLEWIRDDWINEEDPTRLAAMFLDPAGMLKTLAPEFKRVEPVMEDCFWRSRYGKQ